MIVSVSRRTDIPAFYHEWFFNRLAAGFAMTRNPMNPKQVKRVALNHEEVDCFVFWSKNPAAFLAKTNLLSDYCYYFLFTLTPYAEDLEPGLPDKKEVIKTFQRLSETIGRQRVVWRYDPIIFTERYNMEFHVTQFERLCSQLAAYTERCIISFYDHYAFITRNLQNIDILSPSRDTIREVAAKFAVIAREHRLLIETCAEAEDFDDLGIAHGRCVDDRLIKRISGRDLYFKRDSGQRALCRCVKSVDIGAYSTCLYGCRYCYAARQHLTPAQIMVRHDPSSPFLVNL
jgi:hypothetical protein